MPRNSKNKDKEAESPDIEPKEAEVQEDVSVSASDINLNELSDTELDDMEQKIADQKINNHLESEKAKIKKVKCANCGKPLGLKAEDYLKEGNIPQGVECPKCEMLNTVSIQYNGDPTVIDAVINVTAQGYAWETQAPSTWTDDHIKRWAQEESKKMDAGQSTLTSIENQKIFQCLRLVMKKQKLIK